VRYRFGDPLVCQRHHVIGIVPWADLATEQRLRLDDRPLSDWNRKWRLQLVHALNRAAWAARVQRWHREAFNATLPPFEVERLAAAYQRIGERGDDASRQQIVRGMTYGRALRSSVGRHAVVRSRSGTSGHDWAQPRSGISLCRARLPC
jgi:hypothetical protein